jgi:hypothetical protein
VDVCFAFAFCQSIHSNTCPPTFRQLQSISFVWRSRSESVESLSFTSWHFQRLPFLLHYQKLDLGCGFPHEAQLPFPHNRVLILEHLTPFIRLLFLSLIQLAMPLSYLAGSALFSSGSAFLSQPDGEASNTGFRSLISITLWLTSIPHGVCLNSQTKERKEYRKAKGRIDSRQARSSLPFKQAAFV